MALWCCGYLLVGKDWKKNRLSSVVKGPRNASSPDSHRAASHLLDAQERASVSAITNQSLAELRVENSATMITPS